MIKFDRFILSNGLRVLVHEDRSTPMAVVNVLYDVGSKDEHPDKTGFAHLFEHLMFGEARTLSSMMNRFRLPEAKIMPILQMILPIIIASCLQKILKLHFGSKATGC